MFDRLREFISPDVTVGPREGEDSVSRSYQILQNEVENTEKVKDLENFQAEEHAQRVRTRIGNLTKEVLRVANQDPKFTYFGYIRIEPGVFYLPPSNKLVQGIEEFPPSAAGTIGVIAHPVLRTIKDIDDKIWCLDKDRVEKVATNVISLLPDKSSQRILAPQPA